MSNALDEMKYVLSLRPVSGPSIVCSMMAVILSRNRSCFSPANEASLMPARMARNAPSQRKLQQSAAAPQRHVHCAHHHITVTAGC
eukprot:scaffold661954_cov61-Prasinocladus_malaysianus.AAC.1